MKKFLVLSGIIFLLIPSLAMAAYFMADESVPSGEVIIGNLYLTGGNPSMAGDLHGDLYAAGGNVSVPGNVTNDVVITGGTVTITGVVGDDVRVLGGDITIDGKVNGEVLAFGSGFRCYCSGYFENPLNLLSLKLRQGVMYGFDMDELNTLWRDYIAASVALSDTINRTHLSSHFIMLLSILS